MKRQWAEEWARLRAWAPLSREPSPRPSFIRLVSRGGCSHSHRARGPGETWSCEREAALMAAAGGDPRTMLCMTGAGVRESLEPRYTLPHLITGV